MPDSFTVATNVEGYFEISLPGDKVYNIQEFDIADSTMLFLSGDMGKIGETVFYDTISLTGTGTLRVITDDITTGPFYLKGTTYSSETVSDLATFQNLPTVVMPQVIDRSRNTVIRDSVVILRDETVTVGDMILVSDHEALNRESEATALVGELEKAGMNIRAISSSQLLSDSFVTSIQNAQKPLLIMNPDLQPALHLSGSEYGSDYGIQYNFLSIEITDSANAISVGLNGVVPFFSTPSKLSWGIPSGDTMVLAALPGEESRAVAYVYDEGDQTIEGEAPVVRSVFLLNENGTVYMTEQGLRLLRTMLTRTLN